MSQDGGRYGGGGGGGGGTQERLSIGAHSQGSLDVTHFDDLQSQPGPGDDLSQGSALELDGSQSQAGYLSQGFTPY
jgi:hypothetical protein